MSEEINESPSEEINSEEIQSTEASTETVSKPRLPKPEPPAINKLQVYRLMNGEWDDFAEAETIEVNDFYLMLEKEFLADGTIVTEAEFDSDGTEMQRTVNTFNETNKLVLHELHSDGILAEKITCEYDEKGRLIKEVREFEDGFPLATHFTYNEDDQIIGKRTDDNDGELQKEENFEYHPVWKDKIVRHTTKDEEGVMTMEEMTEWEERDGEIKTKELLVKDHSFDTTRKTVFFNPKEREDGIAYATYNERDKVIEYVKVSFDEEGREAQEQSISVNESDNFIVYYTYDEYGRVSTQEQHQQDKIISKINRRFNAQGSAEIVAVRSFSRGMYVDLFKYEYFPNQ
jgi:YD repeat-containing protein